MSSRVVIATASVVVVEVDGKLQAELEQDVPLAHGIPILGTALPARETVPIANLEGVVAFVHGSVDNVKAFIAGKKA